MKKSILAALVLGMIVVTACSNTVEKRSIENRHVMQTSCSIMQLSKSVFDLPTECVNQGMLLSNKREKDTDAAEEAIIGWIALIVVLVVGGSILMSYIRIQDMKKAVERLAEKKEKEKENARLEAEYNARHAGVAKGNAPPKFQEPCLFDMTMPKDNEWKCYQCSRINGNNFGICRCGMKQIESRKLYAQYEEHQRKREITKKKLEELRKKNGTDASSTGPKPKTCSKCGYQMRDEDVFCLKCGNKYVSPTIPNQLLLKAKTCSKCGYQMRDEDVFCLKCGNKYETASQNKPEERF